LFSGYSYIYTRKVSSICATQNLVNNKVCPLKKLKRVNLMLSVLTTKQNKIQRNTRGDGYINYLD
jgi:hypothetical protein